MSFDCETRRAEARRIQSSTESLFFILGHFADRSSPYGHLSPCQCPRLEETLKFLERKFHQEERAMVNIGDPAFEAHKADHDGIMLRLQAVIDTCACGDARVDRMFKVLEDWAKLHARQFDQELIKKLRQPPQRSFLIPEASACENC